MDAELKAAFEGITRQLGEFAGETRDALRAVDRRIDELRWDVSDLKKAVFGSEPPPPTAPDVAAKVTPVGGTSIATPASAFAPEAPSKVRNLAQRTERAEANTDRLEGMVLAVDGRTASIDERTKTLEQSVGAFLKAKGIAAPTPEGEPDPSSWARLTTFVGSREFLKFVVAMVTLAGVLSTAIDRYVASHGPASTATKPDVTVQP